MDPIIPQPEQPQYQALMPEHKHFLNKKFIVTFMILILLGTSAYAGIMYWQNQQTAQEVAPTFTPRPSASALPDTSTWKTYTNTQYGFEIKYPPQEVGVSQLGPTIKIEMFGPIVINIETVNVGRESVFDSSSNVKLRNITFAGRQAKEYICPDLNICPTQLAHSRAIKLLDLSKNWQSGNEIYYDIAKTSKDIDNKLADQILSTFKFIP